MAGDFITAAWLQSAELVFDFLLFQANFKKKFLLIKCWECSQEQTFLRIILLCELEYLTQFTKTMHNTAYAYKHINV